MLDALDILKQIILKNKTETAVIHMSCLPFIDIYRNVSEKSCWKVNETRFWAKFQLKISGRNSTSEKVVLISRSECFKREFMFHFFKLLEYQFKAFVAVIFGKWNFFVRCERDSVWIILTNRFCKCTWMVNKHKLYDAFFYPVF